MAEKYIGFTNAPNETVVFNYEKNVVHVKANGRFIGKAIEFYEDNVLIANGELTNEANITDGVYYDSFLVTSDPNYYSSEKTYRAVADGEDIPIFMTDEYSIIMSNLPSDLWLCFYLATEDEVSTLSFADGNLSISQTTTKTFKKYDTKLVPDELISSKIARSADVAKAVAKAVYAQTAADAAQTAADAAQTTADAAQTATEVNAAISRNNSTWCNTMITETISNLSAGTSPQGFTQSVVKNAAGDIAYYLLKIAEPVQFLEKIQAYVSGRSIPAWRIMQNNGGGVFYTFAGSENVVMCYGESSLQMFAGGKTYTAKLPERGIYVDCSKTDWEAGELSSSVTIKLRYYNPFVINSSTPDSTKRFKITVDDTGTLSATEVT